MKINVDKEKCIKCGSCVSIASNNFDYDDEGFSKVINDEVNNDVKDAVDCCPTGAISISE